MRLGCILPVASLALILTGGQSLYTSFKNRKPVEVELESLAGNKPEADWLRIKGGQLDMIHAAYFRMFNAGKADSIYVPLVSPGPSEGGFVRVLVLTKDPALVDFTNEAHELERKGASTEAITAFMVANRDKIRVPRTVEGLALFGMDSDDSKKKKLGELFGNLADDVIILEEGKKPSAFRGVFLIVTGGLLGAVLLLWSARKAGQGGPPPLPSAGR